MTKIVYIYKRINGVITILGPVDIKEYHNGYIHSSNHMFSSSKVHALVK